jgi:DNA-binding NtrC family response regulator
MKLGALDYLIKPFSMDELRLQIRRAVAELALTSENRALRRAIEHGDEQEIVGTDPGWLKSVDLARRVAADDSTVLITGETGTGKELVARLLHRENPGRTGPFIALNCAAVPESMLERELFGNEKGAYTGADASRPGFLEAAEDGTLLLDEIAEMSPPLQAKLLRVIEGHEFMRLGGTRPVQVHARFVAATNRDLAKLVADGAFRQDLFYRLNVVSIGLPPLRDRGDDVILLAEHFLARFAARKGRGTVRLSPDAAAALQAYQWPGNVREMRNVIECAVILCQAGEIRPADLRLEGSVPAGQMAPWDRLPYREARDAFERAYLERVLKESGGNITKAAARIGLDRKNLLARIRKHGLKTNP